VVDTGDMAYMVTRLHPHRGRIKDIIIRGGENVPVFDIENLLSSTRRAFDRDRGYPDRGWENGPAHSWCCVPARRSIWRRAGADAAHRSEAYWPERVRSSPIPKDPAAKCRISTSRTSEVFAEPPRKASDEFTAQARAAW